MDFTVPVTLFSRPCTALVLHVPSSVLQAPGWSEFRFTLQSPHLFLSSPAAKGVFEEVRNLQHNSREWPRTWIIQQDNLGWWGWAVSVDHNVVRHPLPLGPASFPVSLGFLPRETTVWGTGVISALALMWDQSKDRILCQDTSEAHPSDGETDIWTVKQRFQVEAGFKAHLSRVLTAQDLAQQCLSLPMNLWMEAGAVYHILDFMKVFIIHYNFTNPHLQSHRGWIHLSTVKLGANCWSSPESSRLGYPSCCQWPSVAFTQSFTSFVLCILEIISPAPT